MRRALLTLLAAVLAALGTAVPAQAYADAPERSVSRWDATYTIQDDGSVDVRIEIDFDFGDYPGHGPYFYYATTVGYDDDYQRVYRITDIDAESTTGAPAFAYVSEEGYYTTIRIGDEDIGDVSGVQTYVLTYTVHDVLNATMSDETDSGVAGDELYLDVVPAGWETHVSDISVTVEAPGASEVLGAQCFAGVTGSSDSCGSAGTEGTTASFSQKALEPGEALSVATLYPAGTYPTEPVLEYRSDFRRTFIVNWWTVGGSLLLLAVGGLVLWRRLHEVAFDEQYAGLPPGVAPASTEGAQVVRRDKRLPIAVQFEPPRGLRPGVLGTLIDEKADVRDVTATLIDLAVRGHLRIEEVPGDRDDYRLVSLRNEADELLWFETAMLNAIFEKEAVVTLSTLKTTFASDLKTAQQSLYTRVVDLGWFRASPQSVRSSWVAAGAILTGAGAIGLFWAFSIGTIGLLTLPLILLGVAVMISSGAAPARTAEGSRILAQTKGFELYLRTAEGNQLRFEEGQDIFSRYLPYAVAFDIAEEWAKKFEDLAAQGFDVPVPNWYVGSLAGTAFWMHAGGFSHSIGQFSSLADAAISAPTPSSSGGSGFGGGGGFSGGGGFGGGGGGGW